MGATNGSLPRRLLLAWDEPNICISHGVLIRVSPNSTEKLSLDRVAAWLANRAQQRRLVASATVFTNVPMRDIEAKRDAAQAVRSAGFGLYARPKRQPGDDVDAAIAAYIRAEVAKGHVAEVIVASHDRRAFAPVLADAAAHGVSAFVLGYPKLAAWADDVEGVSLIDMESVAHCFREGLPAGDLAHLPAEGALLPPLGGLRRRTAVRPAAGSQFRPPKPGVTLLLEALRVLGRGTDGGWVLKARLRPEMRRLDPQFTPESYGYANLAEMLKACNGRVKVRQGSCDQELALKL